MAAVNKEYPFCMDLHKWYFLGGDAKESMSLQLSTLCFFFWCIVAIGLVGEVFVSPETMEGCSKANKVPTKDYSENLLCHYLFSDGSAQYVFLDLVDEASAVVNQSLSFRTDANLHICASASGLLLLSFLQDNQPCYCIYNPFSKWNETLPQPQITRRSIRIGLAYDGFHYQVVRVFSIQGEEGSFAESSPSAATAVGGGFLDMEIYSSETGIWRQHSPLIHLPPDFPKLETTPLFANGAIHWELGGHLLIYYVNCGLCGLIELPNYPRKWTRNSLTFGQCLRESESGLHYCCSDSEGIHTWVLLKEQDHDNYCYYHSHGNKFHWRLVHTVAHQNLISRNPDIFLRIGHRNVLFSQWEPYFVSPFVYIENSQTMYLRLPGSIVSYNLRTQTLREICTYECPSSNFYCCLLFPVAYGSEDDSPKKRPAGGFRDVVSLPIGGLEKPAKCK